MNKKIAKLDTRFEPVVMLKNDFNNEHTNFLIIPTVRKMMQINVSEIRVKINNGEVEYLMIPNKEGE